MAWRITLRRKAVRASEEVTGIPAPVAEELAEMAGGDPLLYAVAYERRRDRGRRPREEVYSRYGYLLFLPTTR